MALLQSLRNVIMFGESVKITDGIGCGDARCPIPLLDVEYGDGMLIQVSLNFKSQSLIICKYGKDDVKGLKRVRKLVKLLAENKLSKQIDRVTKLHPETFQDVPLSPAEKSYVQLAFARLL